MCIRRGHLVLRLGVRPPALESTFRRHEPDCLVAAYASVRGIANQIGRSYSVDREGTGRFKITFSEPFILDPVAMVTVHQAGDTETKYGIGVSIEFTDRRSVCQRSLKPSH
jgi:hypothetical protein